MPEVRFPPSALNALCLSFCLFAVFLSPKLPQKCPNLERKRPVIIIQLSSYDFQAFSIRQMTCLFGFNQANPFVTNKVQKGKKAKDKAKRQGIVFFNLPFCHPWHPWPAVGHGKPIIPSSHHPIMHRRIMHHFFLSSLLLLLVVPILIWVPQTLLWVC